MGYHSEVGLVILEKDAIVLQAMPDVKELLKTADVHYFKNDAHLYFWGCIKWSSGSSDVSKLIKYLSSIEYDDWFIIRIGEEYGDKEDAGGYYNNPFNLCCEQHLSFYAIDDQNDQDEKPVDHNLLKTMNSKPNATHCFKCNIKLKEPYPGIKLCPVCEDG